MLLGLLMSLIPLIITQHITMWVTISNLNGSRMLSVILDGPWCHGRQRHTQTVFVKDHTNANSKGSIEIWRGMPNS